MTGFAGRESLVEVGMQLDCFGNDGTAVEFGSWPLLRVTVDVEFVVPLARIC